jgi:hypothetical protein
LSFGFAGKGEASHVCFSGERWATAVPDRRLRHRPSPRLLIGLGTAAAEHGHPVRNTTAALVNELVESADDQHLSKTTARYGRVGRLCLDLCPDRDHAESSLTIG